MNGAQGREMVRGIRTSGPREGSEALKTVPGQARDLRNAETIMSIKPEGKGPSEPVET